MEKLVLRIKKIVGSWQLSIIKANFYLNSCPNQIFKIKFVKICGKKSQTDAETALWVDAAFSGLFPTEILAKF